MGEGGSASDPSRRESLQHDGPGRVLDRGPLRGSRRPLAIWRCGPPPPYSATPPLFRASTRVGAQAYSTDDARATASPTECLRCYATAEDVPSLGPRVLRAGHGWASRFLGGALGVFSLFAHGPSSFGPSRSLLELRTFVMARVVARHCGDRCVWVRPVSSRTLGTDPARRERITLDWVAHAPLPRLAAAVRHCRRPEKNVRPGVDFLFPNPISLRPFLAMCLQTPPDFGATYLTLS